MFATDNSEVVLLKKLTYKLPPETDLFVSRSVPALEMEMAFVNTHHQFILQQEVLHFERMGGTKPWHVINNQVFCTNSEKCTEIQQGIISFVP